MMKTATATALQMPKKLNAVLTLLIQARDAPAEDYLG
jgi:hypothetical protein